MARKVIIGVSIFFLVVCGFFIFMKTSDNTYEYENNVSFNDNTVIVDNKNKDDSEVKPSTEDDSFDYLRRNYGAIAIIAGVLSFGFFVLFFFLSKKKEW